MRNQKGMTLIELTLVISLASLAVVASATYTLPWLSREQARSSVYDVQAYLQLARIEAVSRNHECRFVLDTSTRTIQVFDGKGTPADTSDDELLYETELTEQVQFARPDTGTPVSLTQIGSSDQWEAVFTSDGSVSSGTGEIAMYGGEEFNRVLVYGAGGVSVERWAGSGWVDGNGGGSTVADGGSSGGSGGGGGSLPIDDVVIDDTQSGGTSDGYIFDVY